MERCKGKTAVLCGTAPATIPAPSTVGQVPTLYVDDVDCEPSPLDTVSNSSSVYRATRGAAKDDGSPRIAPEGRPVGLCAWSPRVKLAVLAPRAQDTLLPALSPAGTTKGSLPTGHVGPRILRKAILPQFKMQVRARGHFSGAPADGKRLLGLHAIARLLE